MKNNFTDVHFWECNTIPSRKKFDNPYSALKQIKKEFEIKKQEKAKKELDSINNSTCESVKFVLNPK